MQSDTNEFNDSATQLNKQDKSTDITRRTTRLLKYVNFLLQIPQDLMTEYLIPKLPSHRE